MFADAEIDDFFLNVFVEREKEISALEESLARNQNSLIVGRRGSGKTTLLMRIRPNLKEKYPGGCFYLNGGNVGREVEQFLSENKKGFESKAILILDDTDTLSNKNLSNALAELSNIENLRVIGSISRKIDSPAGFDSIELGSIDSRAILELRLKYLAGTRGNEDIGVRRVLNVIDAATSKVDSSATPRETLAVFFDILRAWESEKPNTDQEQPYDLNIISKVKSYLKDRIDHVGVLTAVALYLMASLSNDEHEDLDSLRHEQLLTQIQALTAELKPNAVAFFTIARLNLRSKPEVTSNIIIVLDFDIELEVHGSHGVWLQVKDLRSSKIGWVHGKYVIPIFQQQSSKKRVD